MKGKTATTQGLRAHINRAWVWLTEPAPAIQEPDRRRQAQLLSALLILLVILIILSSVEALLVLSERLSRLDYVLPVVASVLLVFVYGLSRTPHYKLAAGLAIGLIEVVIYIIAIPSRSHPNDLALLAFLTVPVLLSGLFFPARTVFWLVIANTVGMVLVLTLGSPGVLVNFLSLLTFVLFSLIGLITHYQALLEQDRRASLAESEARYRAVFEQAGDGILLIDIPTGVPVEFNDRAHTTLGYTREEFGQLRVSDIEEGVSPVKDAQGLKVLAQKTNTYETQLRTKQGDLRNMLVTIRSVAIRGEKYLLSIHRDITEHKRAEAALRQSEQEKALILGSLSELVSYQDRDLRVIWANRAAGESVGQKPEDLIGRHCYEIWAGRDEPCVGCPVVKTLETGEPEVAEINTPDGRYWFIRADPVRDEAGNIVGAVETTRDITARKQAEEALRKSEAMLSSIFRAAPTGIGVTVDRVIQWTNETLQQMVGYSADELAGQLARMLYESDEEYERVGRVKYGRIQERGTGTLETRFRRKDGRVIDVLLSSTPLDLADLSAGVTFTALDITDRLRARRELERRNLELALFNEVIAATTSTLSVEEVLDVVCRQLATVLGVPQAVALLPDSGFTQATVVAEYLVGDQLSFLGLVFAFDEVPAVRVMLERKTPLALTDLMDDPNLAAVHDLIRLRGTTWALILPLVVMNNVLGVLMLTGMEPRAFVDEEIELAATIAAAASQALHNARLYEELENYSAMLMQAVEERTVELQQANERLLELSQMKDEFVSNVSHELRTPITNLKLRQHLLGTQPDKLDSHLAVLRRETGRLERIIEDLLYLSRLDQERVDLVFTQVNLNDLAAQYVSDRALLAESRGLALTFEGQPNLPAVQADEGLLGQALSILLTNALSYTPRGGKVIVRTMQRTATAGQWLGLSVVDTGVGILPEEQARLFERFFRGSAGYNCGMPGTGLGLSIVHEIVERHQGRVEVTSGGLDKGSIFTIWLPVP